MTPRAVQTTGILVALSALVFLTLLAPLVTYLDFNLARAGKVVGGEVLAVSVVKSKLGVEYRARIEFDVDGKVYMVTLPAGQVRPSSQVAIRYAPMWPRYAVIATSYPEPTRIAVAIRLLISLVFGLLAITLLGRCRSSRSVLGRVGSQALDHPTADDSPSNHDLVAPLEKQSSAG